MKRYALIIMTIATIFVQQAHAQYYSVNFDAKTVAAMVAAYGTGTVAEAYYDEQVQAILKHYKASEVATAGIFASKFLERKALTDLGIWSSATENYYYRRIYHLVAHKIIPKTWIVAKLMLRSPQAALHWGSYLMKVCDDTKALCMQFESIVTNSTLSFSDIAFLEFNEEIAAILKLSEIGNVDWERLFDDLSKVPGNFTKENLKADLDKLYQMGAGLATSGITNIGNALLLQNSFHELMNGKVSKVIDIYEHYSGLFEQLENNAGQTILGIVGGPDNVAGLFKFSDYNLTSWITDYLDELRAAIIPSGGISPDVTVAACRFVTMCLRPMTRAFLKVANGPASRQAIRISIPMPRNGNRPFPIRSVMQDGQETGCNSSTMPMTDSITPSIIISTVTSSKKERSRPRKHTPTKSTSRKVGTTRKSFTRICLTPTPWT